MTCRSAALGSLVLLLVGCGSQTTPSAHTVRDSAGVRIVETVLASDTLMAPWRVPPEPAFRVGWEDDGLLIEDVVSGVVLNDGRLAVGDGGSQLIHLLDRSGSLMATFGGQGQGPREFGQLTGIVHVGGDTLLAADGGNGRVAVVAGEELVEHARFMSWIGSTAFGFIGRVGGGYALSPAAFMGPDESEPGWHRYPVLRLDLELASLDTLTVVNFHWHARPGDDNPMRPVGAVTVAGGEVVHGTTDQPELMWIADDGSVRQIARWSVPTVEVGEGEWAVYESGYREQYGDRYGPADLARRLAARREDFSGVPPYYGRAFGDRDGRVWLSPYQFAGATNRSSSYTVVAPDGRYLGRIDFPRAIRLLDIAGDVVLGVEYDDYDVQAVTLYRLEDRPGESGGAR